MTNPRDLQDEPTRSPLVNAGPVTPIPTGPRTSLISLPFEVLERVASHLDKSSALSLARTARLFVSVVDQPTWRNVNASIAKRFDHCTVEQLQRALLTRGLALSVSEEDELQDQLSEDWQLWSGLYCRKVEQLLTSFVRETIQRIIDRGTASPMCWKYMQSITIDVYPASVDLMIRLLQNVALHNVGKLDILGTQSVRRATDNTAYEPLEARLFDLRSSQLEGGGELLFPSLTHLYLGRDSVRTINGIPLFCLLAPNLTTLSFEIQSIACRQGYEYDSYENDPDEENDSSHGITPLSTKPASRLPDVCATTTRLRTLRCTYFVPPCSGRDLSSLRTLMNVLEQSPHLECLQVKLLGTRQETQRFLDSIRNKQSLRSIQWEEWHTGGNRWGGASLGIDSTSADALATMPDLRELSMAYNDGHFPQYCHSLPVLPQLETLRLNCTNFPASIAQQQLLRVASSSPFTFGLDSDFVTWLRDSPRLHQIDCESRPHSQVEDKRSLGAEDQPETSTALIGSIKHGADELLHVRFLVRSVRLYEDEVSTPPEGRVVIFNRDLSDHWINHLDMPSICDYDIDPIPSWHDYTDFKGDAVPLSIIQEMRKVEGVCEEDDWGRRGVEVGGAAWKVLTDWRESVWADEPRDIGRKDIIKTSIFHQSAYPLCALAYPIYPFGLNPERHPACIPEIQPPILAMWVQPRRHLVGG